MELTTITMWVWSLQQSVCCYNNHHTCGYGIYNNHHVRRGFNIEMLALSLGGKADRANPQRLCKERNYSSRSSHSLHSAWPCCFSSEIISSLGETLPRETHKGTLYTSTLHFFYYVTVAVIGLRTLAGSGSRRKV